MCPNCVPWCHREHPYNALMVSTVPRWFYSSFFLFSLGNSSAATGTRPPLASAAACCKTRCALTQTTSIYKNKGGVICWNLFWLVWECLKVITLYGNLMFLFMALHDVRMPRDIIVIWQHGIMWRHSATVTIYRVYFFHKLQIESAVS